MLFRSAAHAVIDVIEQDNLEERALVLGERIQEGFRQALDGNNNVKEIRGAGLMLAVELNDDAPDLVHRALTDGVLINVTQGNIVRLLPPLTMTDAEADELVAKVSGLINP